MEGKKEATLSSKKLERNQTSESEYLSFFFEKGAEKNGKEKDKKNAREGE
jgi:hypothetical protein